MPLADAAAGGGDTMTLRRSSMAESEALQVLNLEMGYSREEVLEVRSARLPRPPPARHSHALQRFEKYFQANDPASGGSFYLQSKVFRAKECLEEVLDLREMEEQEGKEDEQERTSGRGRRAQDM